MTNQNRSSLPGVQRPSGASAGRGSERVVIVERRSYSRSPWRLIDSLTGSEVTFPVEFDHPNLGKTFIQEAGFDTKQEALLALGRLAARALPTATSEEDGSYVSRCECGWASKPKATREQAKASGRLHSAVNEPRKA